MTTPQQLLVDVGNARLAQVPVDLHTGTVPTPAGTVGVATFRTASTTLTVFLSAADLRNWASLLTGLADTVGGALVQASAADVAGLNHRGAGA